MDSTFLFAIYGICIKTPSSWRVELNPKSESAKGDVVFHINAMDRFYISWGPLIEATSRFSGLEEHANYSIQRVRSGRNVESLQINEKSVGAVAGHDAIYTFVKIKARSGFLGRTVEEKDVVSLHFYCDSSQRFFVVYQLTDTLSANSEDSRRQFREACDSFTCHE